MGWLYHHQLLFFATHYLLLLFSFSASLASCSSHGHSCPPDQSLALLLFQQNFHIDGSTSMGCDSNGNFAFPRTATWNASTDCCTWEGIECEELTGNVIVLDLSCSLLQGNFQSNNTLFRLSHLQRLSLASNDFSLSSVPRNIGGFASLTHLNLSGSGFSGQVPSEISLLSRLVSLDLSNNDADISLAPHTFRMLLRNLTQLRELSLSGVQIPSALPLNLSSSLVHLDLSNTGLQGKVTENIFSLPNLKTLKLMSNLDLSGNLPEFSWNNSSPLEVLSVTGTSFSGKLPDSFGQLMTIQQLDLSNCQFSGSIPEWIGNLTQITDLLLFSNDFSGQVPLTLSNLKQLTRLDLSFNHLDGVVTNAFRNLGMLTHLMCSGNNFSGQFPLLTANLTKLESLDFSSNMLSGILPSNNTGFENLSLLLLRNNSFSGIIPPWIFSLLYLKFLDLSSNQLTGQIHEFQSKSLTLINFSDNKLRGAIPKSISDQVNLTTLHLSSNNFSGSLDVGMFSNLRELRRLGLSYNCLSLRADNDNTTLPSSLETLWLSSCQIQELDFLRNLTNVGRLDLSHNKISGHFPEWASSLLGEMVFYLNLSNNFLTGFNQRPFQSLVYLDLSSNLLEGPLPLPPLSTSIFFISHNKLTGVVPSSICNLGFLSVLDVSYNNLSGVIPQCLGTLDNQLSVINFQTNGLHGKIPAFAKARKLRNLNLNGNRLEGKVPRSLGSCQLLEVLDVGNNRLNGTFPHWLGSLPELQVLVLKSNKFQGPMFNTSKIRSPFLKLRILDLSHNNFTDLLPQNYLKNFKAMMNTDEDQMLPQYMGETYYQDSVTVVIKGQETELVRILSIFTTIDLSSNNFKGGIPDVIGNLKSLRLLNCSNNCLNGEIPSALGNLSVLESLDLSSNQLVGEIPQQLAGLTFLAVLNLSRNHLVGRIPQGSQFNTFGNDSYLGNSGVCGFPLTRNCERDVGPPSGEFQVEGDSDFVSGFTWKAVLVGYGSGTVLGLVIGYLIFLTGKPKWFVGFVKAEELRIAERQMKIFRRNRWNKPVTFLR